ncbi:MAG: three-Cys-motif partner protein TcmP, partial [Armatimonadota bacterium]|nr:three-Cys-motif partner protein TcmP [Armatimonadota bacterium]
SRTRAVMFLDPFGMQVEWSLLEAIGATKAIDLWLLVPIGVGVNRLLTQNDLPPEDWSAKLTKFFGTDEWQQKFYRPKQQPGLFDAGTEQEKDADHESIKAYFVDRLQGIFEKVAPNPLTQRNSKNSPLFLLCFAVGNKKGAPTAIKIAQHLLKE